MPKMVPAFRVLGPANLYPRVMNMGAGQQIEVKVKMTLEPDGPSRERPFTICRPNRSAPHLGQVMYGALTNEKLREATLEVWP